MKANEAPEKIYMPKELLSEEWTRHIEGQDIEYTRTDAFVEKACEWLEGHMIGWNNDFVENFRNYMKGEK